MARFSRVVVLVLAIVLYACCSFAAVEEQGETDEICQLLFDTYIVTNYKIDTAEIDAAQEIIASRGRMRGFWNPVLEELRKNNDWSQARCLDILGCMLESDASARDNIRSGAMTAAIQLVCLPSDVVPELIARARESKPTLLDHYMIALARARDERCKDFFLEIINNQDTNSRYKSTQFHAAVGLANLSDPAGVEWLIQHCEGFSDSVWVAVPWGTRNLDTCCVLALRAVSARADLAGKDEFGEWWQKEPRPYVPKSIIRYIDR